MVSEGLYVAAAATRLALKNRILVDILAQGGDFDVTHFVPEAREILLTLAEEADQDAQRMRDGRKLASRRFSDSDGTHDYRSRDVRNLRRRERQSQRVAKELRARAADDVQLRTLVEGAREAAWAEVSRNIDRTLRIEAARPDLEPDYAKLRDARMQSLRLVDLPRLAAHRRRNEQGAAGELHDQEVTDRPRTVGGIDLSELE
ncbi:MAG: asparagine synthase [Microbacterium sp.]|nr:asparagine synthase [Microbacterium sp.]MBN9194350.1 asparagine synthase [Microbacterium sp.]